MGNLPTLNDGVRVDWDRSGTEETRMALTLLKTNPVEPGETHKPAVPLPTMEGRGMRRIAGVLRDEALKLPDCPTRDRWLELGDQMALAAELHAPVPPRRGVAGRRRTPQGS